MSGTFIRELELTKVVDGDTVKVMLDGTEESLRLACLDTEESRAGGKPVTNAGKLASERAKQFFGTDEEGHPLQPVRVNIEFDTNDPESVCKTKHRGNYGRLLCYVYKDNTNYNLHTVTEGWSPYFVKYGRSRLYHNEFMAAEAQAQALGIGVWNPETNAGGQSRDYSRLIPWWSLRDSLVEDYRRFGRQAGAKSVRLNYADVRAAAENQDSLTAFCDLQGGINRWTSNGAVVFAGSPQHRFNLWIPDRFSTPAQAILRLLEKRYTGTGRSYVYVSGKASMYPEALDGTPQIVLSDAGQLADVPPG